MLKIQPIAKDPISNRLMRPAILFTAILILLGTSCSLQSGSDPTPTPLPPLVSYEKTYYPVEEGAIEEGSFSEGQQAGPEVIVVSKKEESARKEDIVEES